MAVKITFDVEALKLLFDTLGEDFILNIRQATLEEVAGRTVHAITTKEVEKAVEAATVKELNRYLSSEKIEDRPWGMKTVPEVKEWFTKRIATIAKAEVAKIINSMIDRDEMFERAKELIEYHSKVLVSQVEKLIEKNLNETLINTEVNRRLKEISTTIAEKH